MPRETVYTAVTERLSILDAEGKVDERLMPELTAEQITEGYRSMVRMRAFDDKALKLQRQGRMGTWPPIRGQEAVQVGVAMAMTDDDWLIPAFREHGLMLMRGIPGYLQYAYWSGDERGSCIPEGVRCLPIAVPVGSQWQHGTGVGLALKLRDEDAAAVTFGGDGSTSQGDFHEALNLAGVYKSKTVFIIQNNQWAISIPLHEQTASSTLAQKAHAYGLPGLQVDGNDVFAVYVATKEALKRARSGEGASLIEAVTYRMGDHTTADDASRYRSAEEVKEWEDRDPVVRLRAFLKERKWWDDDREETLQQEVQLWVDEQVRALEEMEQAGIEEIFSDMYAEMPSHLEAQLAQLREEVGQ
ncbi:MAG: pyruvate dehydrogenase (acetyl-transferring) E1 component subunit alpha [bacterium]|nr:pyruvate dehydrogenase (acetyl-transferring) E1 component subunit alpha [bacterium]